MMKYVSDKNRFDASLWTGTLLLTGALVFVWPIPGTIALRNVTLGLLFVCLILGNLTCRNLPSPLGSAQRPMLIVYVCLTAWILIVIVGWGEEPSLNWQEFRGQWLVSSACALSGVLLARWGSIRGATANQALIKTIFYVLVCQVLLHNILDAYYLLKTGGSPFRQAPVLYLPGLIKTLWAGRPLLEGFAGLYVEKFSYVNSTLAAFIVAEICQRLLTGKRWLHVPNSVLGIGLALVFLASYWMSVRNGNMGLLSLIVLAGSMIALRYRERFGGFKILIVGIVGCALAFGLAASFWKTDPRWQTLAETIPIAFDTEKNKAWISSNLYPYPLLANGEEVNPSNYERIAWIKEGVKMSLEHPLGTGYDRNAFFDGLDRKLEMNGQIRGGFSHSGIVDFVIANGYPGLVLWLLLLGLMLAQGWKIFTGPDLGLGLMLAFVVGGFLFRSVLDSTLKDHMLQQFAFIAAILSTLCNAEIYPANPGRDYRR